MTKRAHFCGTDNQTLPSLYNSFFLGPFHNLGFLEPLKLVVDLLSWDICPNKSIWASHALLNCHNYSWKTHDIINMSSAAHMAVTSLSSFCFSVLDLVERSSENYTETEGYAMLACLLSELKVLLNLLYVGLKHGEHRKAARGPGRCVVSISGTSGRLADPLKRAKPGCRQSAAGHRQIPLSLPSTSNLPRVTDT